MQFNGSDSPADGIQGGGTLSRKVPRFRERYRFARACYLTVGERAYVRHQVVLEGVVRRWRFSGTKEIMG